MTPEEAIKIVNQLAIDNEIDSLLVDLLRAPSPQTELQEADPNLKKFVAGFIAPRLETLTEAQRRSTAWGICCGSLVRIPAKRGCCSWATR